ncbi:CD209 antigen-like isoform X1 [Oncorhynchus keta]|uniref:CD209 antigen-like isoform X1 n=2 Tax=Oncorhynchus keta TaxID=8018 RepID=UPI00227D0CA9|nr:CD209 antigen-like isoform X1 [Oncorhynchus keta]XP_052372854.1 CD209 antigen-like isoform X1 [Oncorhynchus keta]XP_052372855.1 CD209 antigen-like isoform X1 [Oncorhynchus keta]XP_052372856.1 CD209 antigen-like isoform X1 [Oncorhynchus keta]XP_052372857.1 CD209 antigen-like isoform X1 [Oncorhynchus keta]XP_052372858.1 CD209 antigen-like isoform X1 [Oncorhynchus keta]XP_052372859.1 CD209 antigen-like isoform X1 [Oncorhynchus keta]XP_052372860.1 CD209 antigen-like isoform X1 [Oncorhynchus k
MCSGLDKKKPHNSNLTFRAHSVHLVTLDIFTHQCNIFGRISFQLSKTVVENPTMQTMDIDKDTYANKPRKKDYIGVTFSANFQWWKRPSGVAAVCLGLLCVLLLAGIIGLSVYYTRVIGHYYSAERFQTSSLNNLTKERDQLKTSYTTPTKERNQLKTSYNTLTKERNQLQTSYNTLTKERDQLQTSYNTLTKERDQLQTRYNTLTKERDQLQTSSNTLTKERDQLQTSYHTLTKERDQLQTSSNTLTKERDQLQTSSNTLTKERDQLQTSSNTLTKERDQLQTSYNTLTKERDQLQTSYHTLTKERDQLQTSSNTLTKERDQLQTSSNTLTKERDQLQTSSNTLTKERDQLQTSSNTLTKERDQLQTSYNTLTKERDHLKEELNKQSCGWKKFKSSLYYLSTEKKSWTESRQDCLGRGAHLVIINSKEEQEFIHEWSGCLEIYLGFHDTNTEGVWEWINDGALDQSSAPVTTYWRDGEPNDANQAEDCAHLSKKASDPLKSWNDVPCTTNIHWMCEKTTSTL